MAKVRLTYDTPEIQAILDSVAGKADMQTGTTAYWNSRIGFVPDAGTLIVYTDYKSEIVDGVSVDIPGIKVGSGNAYVQDLAFIDEGIASDLLEHVDDNVRHIIASERALWNSKLNVDDNMEVVGEALIFNRN